MNDCCTELRRWWGLRRSSRFMSVVVMLTLLSTTGCGSVGKTIGVGLAATGVVVSATTGILGYGCTTPNPNNPQIEVRGLCMPAATYEEAKPVIWTSFVLGIIMAAAGVAIIATVEEKPQKLDPPRRRPRPDPPEEQSCKESNYCY